ncbi:hypothetical protein M0811_12038 [Anaeramoeba ignava]|uniref:Uncharacterized protein n=1 Tax=Anaeramoeba ignava TaxID=1746090 RepID=A0A9Q0LAA0_ANAIG|nr:hypothetical protein M0811_12038 [Anaeramoeba ignava]
MIHSESDEDYDDFQPNEEFAKFGDFNTLLKNLEIQREMTNTNQQNSFYQPQNFNFEQEFSYLNQNPSFLQEKNIHPNILTQEQKNNYEYFFPPSYQTRNLQNNSNQDELDSDFTKKDQEKMESFFDSIFKDN